MGGHQGLVFAEYVEAFEGMGEVKGLFHGQLRPLLVVLGGGDGHAEAGAVEEIGLGWLCNEEEIGPRQECPTLLTGEGRIGAEIRFWTWDRRELWLLSPCLSIWAPLIPCKNYQTARNVQITVKKKMRGRAWRRVFEVGGAGEVVTVSVA
ncbi:hypothetical protein TIFTF001_000620 [Ficus carica]|uniref:Uncharacterized protein n=1 Tax=Ficus carica TaxID=3494 RepID=A0AA88CPG5_FICCA|nr:hypothetical protein TIFTF001_000620 [Ficus carica]